MLRYFLLMAFICLIVSSEIKAQQLPQYTQYILNKYVINPASAGTEDYFLGQSNYRSQWEGVRDAPKTYILSVNGPIQHQKMGIGGYIFSDVTGPTRRNGMSLSYSYHFQLDDEIRLSFALNAGILNYTVDGTQISFDQDNDQVASANQENTLYPDAGFSFYLYGKNYFFGASAPQLLRNELNFENAISNPSGRLVNHYFIMGGYTYSINDQFEVEPSFLLKYLKPTPLSYEFTLRGIYEKKYWLGVSYRRADAIGILAGYVLQDNISFGYSYDITNSELQNYSTGSHEIMLSFRFNSTGSRKTVTTED